MFRAPVIALALAAALVAPGAGYAQAHAPRAVAQRAAQPQARGERDTANAATAADAETAAPAPEGEANARSRSAFGRVMAIMIGALQRQSGKDAPDPRPVRAAKAATPSNIQVGAAFRDALSARPAQGPRANARPARPANDVAEDVAAVTAAPVRTAKLPR